MFRNSSLSITATFAILVATSPVHQIEGVAIPIFRRTNLTLSNGVFDHDKAILSTIRTVNKHRQNLINIRNNLGEAAFPEGAKILPVAKIPDNLLRLLKKRQSESLTDEIDVEWVGDISIGTPVQPFVINPDTGSGDLWVPSSLCMDPACSAKHKYNAGLSSSSRPQPGSFSSKYSGGTYVSGPVYTETVIVAGIMVKGQYFSPVTHISADLGHDAYDGILGLAFPSVSKLKQNTFVNNAFSQGVIASNSFAMKLAISGSELYLGGVNKNLYIGAIEFHKISSSHPGFWQIGDTSISVNGNKVVFGFETIIDSGESNIQGSPDAVREFYSKIPGSALFDSKAGFYSFPCNPVPNVFFNWGKKGKNWFISPSSFNLGETKPGSGHCIGALAGNDLGHGDNVWILGDSFMKNQYNVFDFGSNSVGFAQLK